MATLLPFLLSFLLLVSTPLSSRKLAHRLLKVHPSWGNLPFTG